MSIVCSMHGDLKLLATTVVSGKEDSCWSTFSQSTLFCSLLAIVLSALLYIIIIMVLRPGL